MTNQRTLFVKPVAVYKMIELFGKSVISTEGDEWKMHRKVVQRAFSEPNNKLVWQETISAVLELFSYWDMSGYGDEVNLESTSQMTRDLALMVISAAGAIFWYED